MPLSAENIEKIEREWNNLPKQSFSRNLFHSDLKQLRENVRAHALFDNTCGICFNVSYLSGDDEIARHRDYYYDAVVYYARHWPEHSGKSHYPVGIHKDNLWAGDKGKARMRLLNYLIHVTR
jgi:hypothetical protein